MQKRIHAVSSDVRHVAVVYHAHVVLVQQEQEARLAQRGGHEHP